MAAERRRPPFVPYRTAQTQARAAANHLRTENLQRIDAVLESYIQDWTRYLHQLPRNELNRRRRVETGETIRVAQTMRAKLTGSLERAIATGRGASFDEILAIQRDATLEIAKAQGIPDRLLGAVRVPRLSMAGSWEALGTGAATWRTLTQRYAGAAVQEAQTLVTKALLQGMHPEELSRRLRPYVSGSESLLEAFGSAEEMNKHLRDPAFTGDAKRLRYNADRIAYSEVHNARAEAELQAFVADPLVAAVRWTLSPDRGKLAGPDACDALAQSDCYGLGTGVFPVTRVPAPPHPFDRCERVPVPRDPSQAGEPKPDPPMIREPSFPGGTKLERARGRRVASRAAHAPEATGVAQDAAQNLPPVQADRYSLTQEEVTKQLKLHNVEHFTHQALPEEAARSGSNVLLRGFEEAKAAGVELPQLTLNVGRSKGGAWRGLHQSQGGVPFNRGEPVEALRSVVEVDGNEFFEGLTVMVRRTRAAHASRFLSTGHELHIIRHELGHAAHWRNVGDMRRWHGLRFWETDEVVEALQEATSTVVRSKKAIKETADRIAGQVSRYAQTQPAEFVAETFAGLMDGVEYSREVMHVYRKLGGQVPRLAPRAGTPVIQASRIALPLPAPPPVAAPPAVTPPIAPPPGVPGWAVDLPARASARETLRWGIGLGRSADEVIEVIRARGLEVEMKDVRTVVRDLIEKGKLPETSKEILYKEFQTTFGRVQRAVNFVVHEVQEELPSVVVKHLDETYGHRLHAYQLNADDSATLRLAAGIVKKGADDVRAAGVRLPQKMTYHLKGRSGRQGVEGSFGPPEAVDDAAEVFINVEKLEGGIEAYRLRLKEAVERGLWASADDAIVVKHELGHAQHWYSLTQRYKGRRALETWLELSDRLWDSPVVARAVQSFKRGYSYDDALDYARGLAKKVSRYAATNASEFVAEVFSGLMEGKIYDDEIVLLYKKLGGQIPRLKG